MVLLSRSPKRYALLSRSHAVGLCFGAKVGMIVLLRDFCYSLPSYSDTAPPKSDMVDDQVFCYLSTKESLLG